MNQCDLERLCRKWQKLLRLNDWRIKVEFVSPKKISGYDGRTDYDLYDKTANVKILRKEDWTKNHFDRLVDGEMILVHELIELHFMSIPELKGIDHDRKEFVANVIADALIELDRRNNGSRKIS